MNKGPQKAKITGGERIRAAVDTESFDEKNNTVEVVFATETPVKRYDWRENKYFSEVLEVSEKAINTERLLNGAPVLDSHDRHELSKVIGVVEDVWINGAEAHAKLRLSEEPEDANPVSKIKKGIIRNLSAGYRVQEYTISKENDELPEYRATKWTPMELSFVPVGADHNSGVRGQEDQEFNLVNIVNPKTMDDNQKENKEKANERSQPTPGKKAEGQKTTPPAAPTVDQAQIRQEAVEQERQRTADITDTCQRAGLDEEFARGLVKEGKTIDQARADIIDEVAKRANPAPTNQGAKATGEDENEQTRNAIIDGIVSRAVPGAVDLKDNEKAQQYSKLRLLDIAKDRLRAAGERFSMLGEQEIVKRAWATTDYPDLLTSTFNRTLRRFYEGSVDEWKFIARQENVTDFREKTGIKVDGAVSFEEIPEGGEYKESPILQSEKAAIKLKKYGRKYSISDIAIINDDLSVFSRLPQIMAVGANQFQSNHVWANITGNKKTPDNKNMFHADHGNFDSTGTAITEAALSKARTAMRRQTSPAGHKLGIRPKYLLVPPELQTTAEKMVSSIIASTTGDVNVFANKLQVVVSDQLEDAKAWYLLADPAGITADGIVYAYLNGRPGLRTESRVNWDTDALEVKGSMAFATAVWGFEGWYKNKGA